MSFGLENLAELGEMGRVSDAFGAFWIKERGIRPVPVAMKYVKARLARKAFIVRNALWVAVFFCALIAFATVGFLPEPEDLKEELIIVSIISPITLLLFLSMTVILLSFRPDDHQFRLLSSKTEIATTEEFCRYVEKVAAWAHCAPGILLDGDMPGLQSLASSILRETAGKILLLEQMNRDEVDCYFSIHAELEKTLEEQYFVLSNLGFASGGYGPYFEQAKAKIPSQT